MGLLALASAKGSPGVTTAAMLFGALWPRHSLVIECDPSGADIAWRMPGDDGETLDPQKGVLSLAAAGRRSLHPGLLSMHSQRIVGGLDVIPGVVVPEQATGIRWDELAKLFSTAPGVDVIADLGRVGAATPQNVMFQAASAMVMLVDTLPSNVVHLRERVGRLREAWGPGMAPPLHVVVVAPPKRERAVRETRDVLDRADVEYESVHHLAHDPKGADFFVGQVRGRPDRTHLVRTGQAIVNALAERTAEQFHKVSKADSAPSTEADVKAGEPAPEDATVGEERA